MTEKDRAWERIRRYPPRNYLLTPNPDGMWQRLAEDGLLRCDGKDHRGETRYAITQAGWADIFAWERRVAAFFAEAA